MHACMHGRFQDHDAPMVWSDKIDFQAAYDASASARDEAFVAWGPR